MTILNFGYLVWSKLFTAIGSAIELFLKSTICICAIFILTSSLAISSFNEFELKSSPANLGIIFPVNSVNEHYERSRTLRDGRLLLTNLLIGLLLRSRSLSPVILFFSKEPIEQNSAKKIFQVTKFKLIKLVDTTVSEI